MTTPSQSMVERVGGVIRRWRTEDVDSRAIAREVFAEMLDATPEMVEAMRDAQWDFEDFAPKSAAVIKGWRAALTAALNEGEGE